MNRYIGDLENNYKYNKVLTYYLVYKEVIPECVEKTSLFDFRKKMLKVSKKNIALIKKTFTPQDYKSFTIWLNTIIVKRREDKVLSTFGYTEFASIMSDDIYTNYQLSNLFEQLGSNCGSSLAYSYKKCHDTDFISYNDIKRYIKDNYD